MYGKKTQTINKITKIVRHCAGWLLAAAMVFTGSFLWDMFGQAAAGYGDDFPGFDELYRINPDTAAWIRMDGTHIDHPVVQGKDNFEYLSKGFDGEYYQGGAVFLDAGCSKDLSDDYLIIHGHHMSGGAMFSDVTHYLEEDFFESNSSGELIVPDGIYELTVIGAALADAYDGELYLTGPEAGMPVHLTEGCSLKRGVAFREDDKLVALSTCAGDMTNARAVVFCRARKAEEK